jgi:hypothetical protein
MEVKNVKFKDYDDFINQSMGYIRHDNRLDSIENWEDGIISKSHYINEHNNYWSLVVYFSANSYNEKSKYYIVSYKISYLGDREEMCIQKNNMHRDSIKAICTFENFVRDNNNLPLASIQKAYFQTRGAFENENNNI